MSYAYNPLIGLPGQYQTLSSSPLTPDIEAHEAQQ
jgi:hypothetical protein